MAQNNDDVSQESADGSLNGNAPFNIGGRVSRSGDGAEAIIDFDAETGELTEATRRYLLGNASLEEKKATIDHWTDVSQDEHDNGNYSKSNSLSKALLIALPRLELAREIEDLRGNIDAYEKLDGDKENADYESAKNSLDRSRKALLNDGSTKIHVDVQKDLVAAIAKMMALLNNLSKDNPSKEIEGGNRLELSKESFTSYVVKLIPKRRESLWRIAEYKSIYGDPWKWKLIYEANKKHIKNPNLIYPGQKFVIPPLK